MNRSPGGRFAPLLALRARAPRSALRENGPKSTHFLLRKRDFIVHTTGLAQNNLYIISNNFALPLPLQK